MEIKQRISNPSDSSDETSSSSSITINNNNGSSSGSSGMGAIPIRMLKCVGLLIVTVTLLRIFFGISFSSSLWSYEENNNNSVVESYASEYIAWEPDLSILIDPLKGASNAHQESDAAMNHSNEHRNILPIHSVE